MNGQIILDKLKFSINDHAHEVSLSFGVEKTGLVGKNGTGKTTLLKLITGEQKSESGAAIVNNEIAYLPQDYQFNLNQSIAEALKIDGKLKAIHKIKNNPANEALLSIIGSDWDIEDRAGEILKEFGFTEVDLSRKLKDLSGGERMKAVLAGSFLFPDRFIILDEPTNNLDRNSKHLLYGHIINWKGGMLIVSHDRELLSLMDRIVELTDNGIKLYGGNYQFYERQKSMEKEANLRLLASAKENYKKMKMQAQEVREKQEKRISHAKKHAATQRIPKIILGAMQRAGQVTAGKLKTLHDERITNAAKRLTEAKGKIPPDNQIHVNLNNTKVPKGKLMAEFKDVSFDYPDTKDLMRDMNFSIYGQERVAVVGPNGSGKTTLVKLIQKELQPMGGTIRTGTPDIAYLDQQLTMLNPQETVMENVTRISGLTAEQSREWLAGFLFSQEQVFKTVAQLSGGERVRVGLAAVLAGNKPAQLLILDEPTNNLDLDSIQKIESALSEYQGNLLVISHDLMFLENIGIERYISNE